MAKRQRSDSISTSQARAWYKEIKPYVSFKIKPDGALTTAQKRKVFAYYDEISALKMRPHQIYRSKSPSRLAKAQEFSRHDSALKQIKVAFVPTAEENSKIGFNKSGNLTITGKHIGATVLFFKRGALIKNSEKEVERILAMVPGAKRFQVIAGEYLITTVSYSPKRLAQAIRDLMQRYAQYIRGKDGKRKKNNHWFGNWMFGVHAFEFKNQRSMTAYRKKYKAKSGIIKKLARKAASKIAKKTLRQIGKLEKRVVKSALIKKRRK